MDNKMSYNILKNDKNSWNFWREFKSLRPKHEFFKVIFNSFEIFFKKMREILNGKNQDLFSVCLQKEASKL